MAALLLAACATLRPPRPWSLPDPAVGALPRQVQQSVTVERDGHGVEFLAVLAQAGSVVTMVGLSPLGQRLMKLTWGPSGVRTEMDPAVAGRFDGEAALRDMVLATWPARALDAGLAGGQWSLRAVPGGRELWWKGRLQVRVQGNAVTGLVLDHVQEGYRVTVKDLTAPEPGHD